MHLSTRQVLSDPSGRRAVLVTVMVSLIFTLLCIAATAVAYGLLVAPSLPAFDFVAPEAVPLGNGGAANIHVTAGAFGPRGRRVVPAAAGATMRLAYYADNDAGSFEALQKHADHIDALLPEWLQIATAEGKLSPPGRSEARTRAWLKANHSRTGAFPVLSSRLPGRDMQALLSRSHTRAALVEAIASSASAHNDLGVAIRLSQFPPTAKTLVARLIGELSEKLRVSRRKTIVIVDDPTDAVWVQQLARMADYLLINCYDQATQSLSQDPLAAQTWVEARVAGLRAIVPADKLIVGLGSFARDLGPEGPKLVSVQAAWDTMAEAGSKLSLDPASLNPRFRYFDSSGLPHDVWLLDGTTVFSHLRGSLPHRPAGVALWRLGTEDPGIWSSFARGRVPDESAVAELSEMQPGPTLTTGTHEFLWVGTSEQNGRRELVFSPGQGLITQQSITTVPLASKISGIVPQDDKAIALTFDDGPHEKVTPKILDILKQKGIKATFFVVGRNAARNPEILRRILAEGHDIGNHSYSHADLSTLSGREFDLEMNSVQRILEAELGVHTTLFRPPFNGTAESNIPEATKVIEAASRMGYITVLSGADSGDWLNPPPEVLTRRVVGKVVAGRGQVILMHDWGERQSTLSALPVILDELTARGYRFVATHELLGIEREKVMPTVREDSVIAQTTADARSNALLALGWFGRILPFIALLGSALCIARLTFVVWSVRSHKRKEATRESFDSWPTSVAVIVPAFNEEAVICKTIQSVLLPNCENYEIIVVDDGSQDATAETVRKAFDGDPRVRVFKKENGGKAAAANFALAHTNAEVVVSIDADTVLAQDAIPLLVRHFDDPRVGAVAGTAVVGNAINFLTRMQSLEYMIGQSLDRRAFALYNANGIVPGAIGAWRRKAIIDVGGYASDTVAEDADITFSLIRAGWTVLYEPRAEARTEAPETWQAFLKQRYRWMFGMLQVITKHGSELRRGTALGFITIPNVLLFQFGFSILIPILDILCFLQLGQAVWQWLHTDYAPYVPTTGLAAYAKWWLLFQAIDLLVMAGALSFGGAQRPLRLIPLLVAQRFVYWPLIYWTALTTMLAAAKGRATGWNKLNRTGRVSDVIHSVAS